MKDRTIWYSLAAIIVLIIGVVVYFASLDPSI